MKKAAENKMQGKPETKASGKENAPGQQGADSMSPAPGKSSDGENRGHTEAKRIQRANDRQFEKAQEQAQNGGGEIQDSLGRPSHDGTLAGGDLMERMKNGGKTNLEMHVDEDESGTQNNPDPV